MLGTSNIGRCTASPRAHLAALFGTVNAQEIYATAKAMSTARWRWSGRARLLPLFPKCALGSASVEGPRQVPELETAETYKAAVTASSASLGSAPMSQCSRCRSIARVGGGI